MKCPFCGEDDDRVIESRTVNDGATVRRRRECNKCAQRFTSYERLEERPLMVIKKDGARQPFDREKIVSGVSKSVEKRPISVEQIDTMIDDIEKKLYATMNKEINAKEIGEMVMEELEKLDQVAYVRFASVYRQFKNVKEFVKEIKGLK
jgi:transcriptional repressor NrdR